MKAWHFVGDKLRDGRDIPADGKWLVHQGEGEMCASGLRFSRDPFDALYYAPGPVLCEVEVEDITAEGSDKGVCGRRMIIRRKDVTEMLQLFARKQALSVIHLWDAPAVIREYLETGKEELREQAAAWAAARAAAWDAAAAAARAVAWEAAWEAVAAVARAAAWEAARYAAWAADREAAWEAARAAAAAAARVAARDAARKQFNAMVEEVFAKEGGGN